MVSYRNPSSHKDMLVRAESYNPIFPNQEYVLNHTLGDTVIKFPIKTAPWLHVYPNFPLGSMAYLLLWE